MPDYDQHVSTRLSWLICKEAIASPQGNGSEFGLESSLQVFACLFSQKANAVYTLGEEEVGLLWNQPPRLWIKLRCGGSWGRGGGSRLPSTFRPAKVKHICTLHIPSLTQIRFLSHQMPLHLRVALPQGTFNCKTTRDWHSLPLFNGQHNLPTEEWDLRGGTLILSNCYSIKIIFWLSSPNW